MLAMERTIREGLKILSCECTAKNEEVGLNIQKTFLIIN